MQILKAGFIVVAGLLLVVSASAQRTAGLWQSWNDIQVMSKKDKKPVIIDIYTNWCRYCKLMEKNTYGHDSVKNYLVRNYYRYKLNAQSRDSIVYMGKVFKYNPLYKVHDFVLYLTKGNVAYPATVILPSENQPPYYELGALEPHQMEMLLKYFGDRRFTRYTLNDWARSFSSKW